MSTSEETKSRSKGPHGLGDPDDMTNLRIVERDVLIPKLIRDKSRTEKCQAEVANFIKCSADNGVKVVFNCRNENKIMQECQLKWFQNEEFRKECTDLYFKERREFRLTGIKKKYRTAEPSNPTLHQPQPTT